MGVTAAVMFGVGAGADIVGAVTESNAQREQAKYQKHQYEVNAKLAEDQGAEAIKLGDQEASQLGKKTEQLRGSQRAAYAAQGIDVNSGVAAEVQADTVALGAADVLKIKDNAWKTAWGYKQEAASSRSKGEFARVAGENAANNTLLTGGLKALGKAGQAAMTASGLGGGGGSKSAPKYSYNERQN